MSQLDQTVGAADNEVLEIGKLRISPRSRTVQLNGADITTTTSEFDLLILLARRAGEVVTREELYQTLLGMEFDGLDRCIDVRVSRLRKKIGDHSRAPRFIKSIRSEGYLLAAEPN